ncbi:hypothetical protein [Haloarchaeobius sp. HRN-SO-5]|uniref:hypothetical protein n=1 Tax=Haloarchaeobius sp. HRN-SO-5 TaxID=3446118 RepID=UPI003EC09995
MELLALFIMGFVSVVLLVALASVHIGFELELTGLLGTDERWETPPIGDSQSGSEDEKQ